MFHVSNYDALFSHTGKFSFETSVRKSVSFIQYGQELILILPKFDIDNSLWSDCKLTFPVY